MTAVSGMTKLVYLTPIAIPALIALSRHHRVSARSFPYDNVYSIATPKKASAISVYAQLASFNREGMDISNISAHQAVKFPHMRRVQSHMRIIVDRAHAKW